MVIAMITTTIMLDGGEGIFKKVPSGSLLERSPHLCSTLLYFS